MKKNVLCLLLVAAMLLPLASCSETTTVEEDTTEETTTTTDTADAVDAAAEEEEEEEISDNLPDDLDFGGYTEKFIAEEGSNGDLSEKSVRVEEDTGDVVDSAIYNRNIEVEDRLNVKIELVEVLQFSSVPAKIRSSVQSGSDDYDIAGVYQYYGIVLAAEGIMYNLDKLEYNDFTAPYWGTQYMDNMAYMGTHYWATGDLALRYTGGMYVSYLNINLWNDLFPGESYIDLVDNNQWTLDTVASYTERSYSDLNGNGEVDDDDQFGFITNAEQDPMEGLVAGSMVTYGEVDAEGNITVTLNNERTYTFWEKCYHLLFGSDGAYVTTSDDSVTTMNMFAEGHSLIAENKLFQAEIYLREMTDDYSILPVPMLDETQEHYNTMLHDGVTLFGLPVTNPNLECSSATLEAMASGSYKKVTPAYFDTALKYKYTRDEDSARMIDLVKENVSSDFVCLWSNNISDIAHFFRNQCSSKTEDISSSLAKQQKAWDKITDKLEKKFATVAENQD